MSLTGLFYNQSVTVRPYLREGSGGPLYGQEEQRACRLERGSNIRTTYKNPDGEIAQIVAEARMFCPGSKIPPESQVVFVTEDGQRELYTVIRCIPCDGFGFSHLEVYMK